ncbi:MAG TPA: leucine--tRNA ligase [Planctomycetes bacterium]|mgnify:CR=1 FL=1|nr:leucine--tRNA ligase [Planctomycetota bacterium]
MSEVPGRYDHQAVEQRWQAYWEEQDTFATPTDRTKPKYYVLDMFPYPSGAGLHVGHPKGYVATDVVARAKRMLGCNVLRVMGWDSFGLPAERQAVKEGKHPREITERNVATFKGQLRQLGLSYDWARELATSDPTYYRWTQWIFLQLYDHGLAYQAEVPVNWCPALGTVLANEEVHDGVYKETGDPVERRLMKQWMFKIPEYAERLLSGLDDVNWPEGIKKLQRDWIGRSEGADITFGVKGHEAVVQVFTTRPDTLFGCTYVVLAPEHELVDEITTDAQRDAIAAYVDKAGKTSERDRKTQAADAPKTGAFTGAYALNPVNGEEVPIWIADYVIGGYGHGAVFACPAHDERDYAFATTFDLPIKEVVAGGDVSKAAYTGDGEHVNSEFLDGLDIQGAKRKVIDWLEEQGKGTGVVRYALRDWLFSRQRYWGEPFPLVELEDGTIQTLPESELPVLLPELDEYKPTADGQPPLARAEDWVNTTVDGKPAKRETNTMPQWAGSCWYYLRFISPTDDKHAWDPEEEKYWMPVDLYVGGAEHAVLHLLYARFWHQVLYDRGLVSTPEPFERLFNQGMVHAISYMDEMKKFYYPHEVEERDVEADYVMPGSDGKKVVKTNWFTKEGDKPIFTKLEKMSKSRCNVANPDDVCEEFGADALRLYELFMGPLEDGATWETDGVRGTKRFLDRVWRLVVDELTDGLSDKLSDAESGDEEVERALHEGIKRMTEGVETLRFNTAISQLMVFVNEATRAESVPRKWVEQFILALSPMAPHICEELWRRLGHEESLAYAEWPSYSEDVLTVATVAIVVQVNGKKKGEVQIAPDASQDDALAAAKAVDKVASAIEGKSIKREIYVPGRLVNIVAK